MTTQEWLGPGKLDAIARPDPMADAEAYAFPWWVPVDIQMAYPKKRKEVKGKVE